MAGHRSGGSISELARQGLLHPECERIFRVGKDEPPEAAGQVIDLHQHQREAVEIARSGASYVRTTGTGSGKSLSYIVPIVGAVLRQHAEGSYQPGVKAIIVYPMLRDRARRGGLDHHEDLWEAVRLVFTGLGTEQGRPELALPGIGSAARSTSATSTPRSSAPFTSHCWSRTRSTTRWSRRSRW